MWWRAAEDASGVFDVSPDEGDGAGDHGPAISIREK